MLIGRIYSVVDAVGTLLSDVEVKRDFPHVSAAHLHLTLLVGYMHVRWASTRVRIAVHAHCHVSMSQWVPRTFRFRYLVMCRTDVENVVPFHHDIAKECPTCIHYRASLVHYHLTPRQMIHLDICRMLTNCWDACSCTYQSISCPYNPLHVCCATYIDLRVPKDHLYGMLKMIV